MRLILDGTVVRVRLDRKATGISLLVVLGVRRDGQKVLLSIKNMGDESEAGWRGVLDDLVARGLRTPEFLMTGGGAGLDRALSGLWPDVPVQRCTVHKQRNLLAHAPDALHDEVSADYSDMIYAATAAEVQSRRRAFLRKWRLRCPAVATSLEEAGERLFSLLRLPPSPPWRLTWQLDRNKSIPPEKRRSGQFQTHRDGTFELKAAERQAAKARVGSPRRRRIRSRSSPSRDLAPVHSGNRQRSLRSKRKRPGHRETENRKAGNAAWRFHVRMPSAHRTDLMRTRAHRRSAPTPGRL